MRFKYLILSTISIFILCSTGFSQNNFTLNSKASKLIITGTSSIHDWEMAAENFKCNAAIMLDQNVVKEISKIDFVCPVETIKSHNKIMDSKTYKALNSTDFPEIQFQIGNNDEAKISDSTSSLKGNLTIAGNKKEIEVKFDIVAKNNKEIIVSGEIPIKMSDFKVEPPTAMMGTLKTGDEVLIKYEFVFSQTI